MDVDLETTRTGQVAPPDTRRKRLTRYAWLAAGWVFCAVGFIGIVLPGLPTTGPLLLALACFARGSNRLHNWLLNHPRFGPPLRHWHEHRVIPIRAKILALSMMAASFVYLGWFASLPAWGVTLLCGLILVGAVVVIRIPHKIAVEPVRATGVRPTGEQGSSGVATDD